MKIDGAKVQFGHISVSFLHIIVRADLKHCHKSYGVIKVFSLTTKILTSDRPSARALQGNIGPRDRARLFRSL